MPIRIGANPICWSNDDMPEIGGDISLEQCLAEARKAGISGMELGNKFPRQAAILRPILKTYGLSLVSGWYSTFLLEREVDAEMEACAAHARLLKAMRCKVLIAAECTETVHGNRAAKLSARPTMSAKQSKLFNRRLTDFAEKIDAAYGLTLVYHHHMGTVVQTGAEIARMMKGTGAAVRLLLDTGHATWAGADPRALAKTFRSRIAHVHTKDVRAAVMKKANARDWSFLDAVLAGVYTVPGDGMIDFAGVFSELPDYSGWAVIEAEQDPVKAPPLEYVTKGVRHLRDVLAKTGHVVKG